MHTHTQQISAALQPGLHSPKPRVEHGQPGSSIRSVSGGAEQEVLLDGHVADERQDEQRHAEHDEPKRACYPHHPASLWAPAPPDQRIRDGPGRGDSEHPGAPHPQPSEGVNAENDARFTQISESMCRGPADAVPRWRGRMGGRERRRDEKAWHAGKQEKTAELLTFVTEGMTAAESKR